MANPSWSGHASHSASSSSENIHAFHLHSVLDRESQKTRVRRIDTRVVTKTSCPESGRRLVGWYPTLHSEPSKRCSTKTNSALIAFGGSWRDSTTESLSEGYL